jgi:hypothetical protein
MMRRQLRAIVVTLALASPDAEAITGWKMQLDMWNSGPQLKP